jgi:hypothetical protein
MTHSECFECLAKRYGRQAPIVRCSSHIGSLTAGTVTALFLAQPQSRCWHAIGGFPPTTTKPLQAFGPLQNRAGPQTSYFQVIPPVVDFPVGI